MVSEQKIVFDNADVFLESRYVLVESGAVNNLSDTKITAQLMIHYEIVMNGWLMNSLLVIGNCMELKFGNYIV